MHLVDDARPALRFAFDKASEIVRASAERIQALRTERL
jgi:hypothetical protein